MTATDMLLAVDIGNSNITFGVFQAEQLIESFRVPTKLPAHEIANQIPLQFHALKIDTGLISHAVICSVVPPLLPMICEYCRDLCKTKPLVVTAAINLGIRIAYDKPEKLGTDRICTSAGAYYKYGAPVIVIDFGTATTINVVSSHGTFRGGLIIPGLETAFNSLASGTAQLPKVSAAFPPSILGTDTVTGIQSGVMHLNKYGIQGILEKLSLEETSPPAIVATGGWSGVMYPHIPAIQHHDPYLILEGMRFIYQLNQA